MSDKMYRLQRDYDYPSGTIRKGVVKSIKEWAEIFPDLVNCDISVKTDWFQPIEPERIDVSGFHFLQEDSWGGYKDCKYILATRNRIPENKYAAIKSMIDFILNPPDLEVGEIHKFGVSDKKYSEKELLEAENKAFNAGREKSVYHSMVDGSEMYKYWKFSNYKSHNQITK